MKKLLCMILTLSLVLGQTKDVFSLSPRSEFQKDEPASAGALNDYARMTKATRNQRSYGGLRCMGRPLDSDVVEAIRKMENEWRQKARAKFPFYKGVSPLSGDGVFSLPVKIIVEDKMPFGVTAWGFREMENGPLIVVIKKPPSYLNEMDKQDYIDEAVFHELKEEWFKLKEVDERRAHRLATYHQIGIFSDGNRRLTFHHQAQLSEMRIERLYSIVTEYNSRRKNGSPTTRDYEKLVRNKAGRLLKKKLKETAHIEPTDAINELRCLRDEKDNRRKVDACLSKLRGIFRDKLAVREYVHVFDELKWWEENVDALELKVIFRDFLWAIQGPLDVISPDSVVVTTRDGRYEFLTEQWLMDFLKRQGAINSFVEVGVSHRPREHLELARALKRHNPAIVSLGLDILPVGDICYEVRDDFIRRYYLDEKGNILFGLASGNKYIGEGDETFTKFKERYATLLEKRITDGISGEGRFRDLTITRIIKQETEDGVFLKQGTFDSLGIMKDVNFIFSANMLRNYLDMPDVEDFIKRVMRNVESALSEGGIFIEANMSQLGDLWMCAVHRKREGRLIAEEVVMNLNSVYDSTEGKLDGIILSFSDLLMNQMAHLTLGDDYFNISNAIREFTNYLTETPQEFSAHVEFDFAGRKILQPAGWQELLHKFCEFLNQEGFTASVDSNGLIHIRLEKREQRAENEEPALAGASV